MAGEEGAPLVDAPDPLALRAEHEAGTAAVAGPLEPVAAVRDVGTTRVVVPDEAAGAVLLLHGGGWVVGSPSSYEHVARILANRAGATVVVPDYRLAPEHRFPAALDDAEAGLALARELAGGGPVAVMGDSAGGQLAAVLARRHHDLAHQALVYPVLDAGRGTDSYRRFATGYRLTADDMGWFFDQYGGDPDDPDLSPLRAADLAGVAPATIVLASHDVLRDEGEAYARRLAQAGVGVELTVAPGTIHGFIRWTGVAEPARVALDAIGARLRAALR